MRDHGASRPRIALVQNQSEMAHYGYADARAALAALGFDAVLFTRENVALLEVDVRDRAFDAVVLASRALSDGVIAETFASERFGAELTAYLESGRGLLCLHQLGLAGGTLDFLPAPLRPVRATKKQAGPAGRGALAMAPGAHAHPLLTYPHLLDLDAVADHGRRFASLPGLYWHGWSEHTAAWEDILVDDGADPPASLAIASQATSPHRVVLLAMPIDWQQNLALFENALVYVATGWEATALLRAPTRETAAASRYLAATLRAWRHPYRDYDLEAIDDERLGALVRRVECGLHRTLVLAPGTGIEELPAALRRAAETRMLAGELRVVALGDTTASEPSYSVFGREQGALGLLGAVELEVQRELHDGYVAGSFWATIEVLQALEDLPERSRDYRGLCERALAEADTHDRDGSYDEVLSATAALFWLRTHAGGEGAERALAWVRRALALRPSPRDEIYALATMCIVGVATPEERAALRSRIEGYPFASASEVDLLTILRAIRLARVELDPAVLDRCVQELLRRPDESGTWLDVSISAAIVVELLKLGHADAMPAVQRAMTCIQRARSPVADESSGDAPGLAYQWDRHPLTTLRCLQAWMLFDARLRFAVDEVVQNLRSRDRFLTAQSTTRSALRVLDELREENVRLREDVDALNGRIASTADLERRLERARRRAARLSVWRFAWAALALVLLYVLVFTLVGVFELQREPTLKTLLTQAGGDHAGLHAALITVVIGLLAIDWRRQVKGGDAA